MQRCGEAGCVIPPRASGSPVILRRDPMAALRVEWICAALGDLTGAVDALRLGYRPHQARDFRRGASVLDAVTQWLSSKPERAFDVDDAVVIPLRATPHATRTSCSVTSARNSQNCKVCWTAFRGPRFRPSRGRLPPSGAHQRVSDRTASFCAFCSICLRKAVRRSQQLVVARTRAAITLVTRSSSPYRQCRRAAPPGAGDRPRGRDRPHCGLACRAGQRPLRTEGEAQLPPHGRCQQLP